jgi:hypothetical protein
MLLLASPGAMWQTAMPSMASPGAMWAAAGAPDGVLAGERAREHAHLHGAAKAHKERSPGADKGGASPSAVAQCKAIGPPP